MAAGAASSVHAADLGRLRVLSATGEPLRAEIAVTALTPHEASTLKAAVAPREVYRQTRLEYAEALAQLKLGVEDRPDGSKVVTVASATPLDVHVLDLLVELTWNMGRFIRQYTFILDAPAPQAQAPESRSPVSGNSLAVKPGDTLYGIAGRLKPDDDSLMQTMAALFQANPRAFIDGNMNRLRAGASLAVPSGEEIAAVDRAQAQALFAAHAQAFEAYRQRIAGQAGNASMAAAPQGAESRGEIAGTPAPTSEPPVAEGDALKLSGGGKETSEQGTRDRLEEERDATAKAVREAETRMQMLQGNVEAMRGLLEAQNETLARMEQQARDRAAEGTGVPAQSAPGAPERTDAATQVAQAAAPGTPGSDESAATGAAAAGAPAPAASETPGAAASATASPDTPLPTTPPDVAGGDSVGEQMASGPATSAVDGQAPVRGAAGDAEPEAFAAKVARQVQDNSVAVFGALVALLAVILSVLGLRRHAARAEAEPPRDIAGPEDDAALEEADALPASDPGRVNHLRDWDDIPPFPIPETPISAAGQPEDYPDDDEPVDPPGGRPTPVPPAATAAFGLDLSLDGEHSREAASVSQDGPPRTDDLSRLDLNADLSSAADPAAKLDLARAYADLGDRDGARELLEEVLREGDEAQREQAWALLAAR